MRTQRSHEDEEPKGHNEHAPHLQAATQIVVVAFTSDSLGQFVCDAAQSKLLLIQKLCVMQTEEGLDVNLLVVVLVKIGPCDGLHR